MNAIDLSTLPPPDVIETLDAMAVFEQQLAQLRQIYPEFTTVSNADPAYKVLQVTAYRETLIRAHINDAVRTKLIAFAAGADLDHAAAFYNVARMADEDDDRLRARTLLRAAALAGNGTPEQYRFTAMSASPLVRDAAIMPSAPGAVSLAIWPSTPADGAAALAAVRTAFAADDAKPLGVPLSIELAVPRVINIAATVYRERSAPANLSEQLAAALPAQIAAYSKLGRDVSHSWKYARLHVDGVVRVELVEVNDVLAPNEYAVAGTIAIQDGGVAW